MKTMLALVVVSILTGCATNVPESRVRQVQQATNTGYYSYQLPTSAHQR